MRLFRSVPVLFVLGACSNSFSYHGGDIWSNFQERCLSPILENRPFVTQNLKPISPASVFPEDEIGSPFLSTVGAFSSLSGDWKMLSGSDGGSRLCIVVSQSEHATARRLAESWAAKAVADGGFAYDHHIGSEIHKRHGNDWLSISFDGAVGWKTGFITSIKPLEVQ